MCSAKRRRSNAGGAKAKWDEVKADERADKAGWQGRASLRCSMTCRRCSLP